MPINNEQKALIHVAAKELGLEEEEYRAILKQEAGVNSCGDALMDDYRVERLMRRFKKLGFKPRRKPSLDAQQKMIYALWKKLAKLEGLDRKALNGFYKRQYGVDHVRFLKAEQKQGMIEALKARLKRADSRKDVKTRSVKKGKTSAKNGTAKTAKEAEEKS